MAASYGSNSSNSSNTDINIDVTIPLLTRCGENLLQLFAVFSATAWKFSVKFHSFMCLSFLHLTAKWHLIISKHDQVIDILLWPLSDFSPAPEKRLRRNTA